MSDAPRGELTSARRAPRALLVLVLALLLPWSALVNLWFAERGLWRPLSEATGGLLHPTLQAALPSVVLWVALLCLGGMRFADFGWRARDLRAGALATLALWTASQLAWLAASGGEPALARSLLARPALAAGALLGQFAGNALGEETVFRGFLLVQLLILLRARGAPARRAAWLAALGSAFAFALTHVPNRIYRDAYGGAGDVLPDQARLVASGLFGAWIYLRTRNLWWAVGVHALANCPTSLVEPRSELAAKAAVALIAAALTLAWPRLPGRGAEGGTRSPRDSSRGPPAPRGVSADASGG